MINSRVLRYVRYTFFTVMVAVAAKPAKALNPLDYSPLDGGLGFQAIAGVNATITTTATSGTFIYGSTTYNAVMVPQAHGPDVAVFTFSQFGGSSNTSITITGSNPVAILSHNDIFLGTVTFNGSGAIGATPGLGAGGGGNGGTINSPGSGIGGGGGSATGGGGGGGFGGTGRSGSGSGPGAGGASYSPVANELIGGSGGGGGGNGGGGGGGGAVEFGATNRVYMYGTVDANGGNGGNTSLGGGGGSGGQIYFHGSQVLHGIAGQITARGGGGSSVGGLGGGGQIIIDNLAPSSVDGAVGKGIPITQTNSLTSFTTGISSSNPGQIRAELPAAWLNAGTQVLNGQPVVVQSPNGLGQFIFTFNRDLWIGGYPALASLGINNPLLPTANVTIDSFGTFRTNNYQQTVASLSGTGTLILDPGGMFTVARDDRSELAFSGTVIGPGTFEKSGRGTLVRTSNLAIQGGFLNSAGTLLVEGATLTAETGVTNNASAELAFAGTASSLVASTLTNAGLISGSATFDAPLVNQTSGVIRISQSNSQRFIGASNSNAGTISLLGGTVEFSSSLTNAATTGLITGRGTVIVNGGLNNLGFMTFSGGVADVIGNVVNGPTGRIATAGGGTTSFFGAFAHNGSTPILTGSGSRTVFLGTQTGAGNFAGSGAVEYYGNLLPGNSPAIVTYGGDVLFGSSAQLTIEIGGVIAGGDFDAIHVAGELSINGDLNVTLYAGFEPSAGQAFDILDWGQLNGVFSNIQLPVLPGTLAWNTSHLYSTGELVIDSGAPGDYSNNGVVDAADYVVWRNNNNSATTLPNDLTAGVTAADYDVWRAHFGQTAVSGMFANSYSSAPEPTTLMLLTLASVGWALLRRYHPEINGKL